MIARGVHWYEWFVDDLWMMRRRHGVQVVVSDGVERDLAVHLGLWGLVLVGSKQGLGLRLGIDGVLVWCYSFITE